MMERWRAWLKRHQPLYTIWTVGVGVVVVPTVAAGVLFYALFFAYFLRDIIVGLIP